MYTINNILCFRVKHWALEGHGKNFRQNLVFSSLSSAQLSALFGKECVSHRGLVKVSSHSSKDVLSQVLYPVRLVTFKHLTTSNNTGPLNYRPVSITFLPMFYLLAPSPPLFIPSPRQVFSRMRERKDGEGLVDYLTTGRYDYFVDNILPRLRSSDMTSIVIIIPSYYDYVR